MWWKSVAADVGVDDFGRLCGKKVAKTIVSPDWLKLWGQHEHFLRQPQAASLHSIAPAERFLHFAAYCTKAAFSAPLAEFSWKVSRTHA